MLVQYAFMTRTVTLEVPPKELDGKCTHSRQVVKSGSGPSSPNRQPPSIEVANVLLTQ
jgi:hypothetical protein